jgi:hypothetical protein
MPNLYVKFLEMLSTIDLEGVFLAKPSNDLWTKLRVYIWSECAYVRRSKRSPRNGDIHVHERRQDRHSGTGPVDKISLYYLAPPAPVHIGTLCSVFYLMGLIHLFDFSQDLMETRRTMQCWS